MQNNSYSSASDADFNDINELSDDNNKGYSSTKKMTTVKKM